MLPSAGLLIGSNVLIGSLTPLRMIGRERSGGEVSSALSVTTIHGGSPSPVYPSTAALLTCTMMNYYYMYISINWDEPEQAPHVRVGSAQI